MISVYSYTATIYVGSKVRGTGALFGIGDAEDVCQKYCDRVGLCVTVTPTQYIYKGGREPGVAVGLINYPRFPSDREAIRKHALALAERLRKRCGQLKVSIVFPEDTVMVGEEIDEVMTERNGVKVGRRI